MVCKQLVSWSELDTARQCPHKHDLAYKQRWTRETTSPALLKGTLWHQVMETHYSKLLTPDEKTQTLDQLLNRNDLLQQTETEELVSWMFDGYLEAWEDDPAWEVVAVEFPFSVPLRYPGKNGKTLGNRSTIHLKGKVDLLVLQDGKLWVVDHKSCSRLPNDKELALDDQFGLYSWALAELGHGVFGSLHNAARTNKPKPDSRPENEKGQKLNQDGSVSKNQPAGSTLEERFKRTRLHRSKEELQTVAAEAYETANAVWNKGLQGRTPDTERCNWRCDFTEACLAGRKGYDEEQFLKDYGFVVNKTRH
jgi:hypothetical protein